MSKLLIELKNISKSFGPLTLFEGITLSINQGNCFAIVGENGAGKTTLLQILSGMTEPDTGSVIKSSTLRTKLLLQQTHFSDLEWTVSQFLKAPLLELEEKMRACLHSPDRLEEWALYHEEYERLGGYEEPKFERYLKELQMEELFSKPLSTLSSGQRMKIALVKTFAEEADLLLLDEPTTHLDAEALLWLKKMLIHWKGAVVLVSHDRKFLNETCNHILEIYNRKLHCYGGNYDFFLLERERMIEQQLKAYAIQKEERLELKQKIRSMSFAKKKPPPPSDRNIMAYDYRGGNHQKSVKHHLDKLKAELQELEENLLSHPKPKSIMGLKFSPSPLLSNAALEIEGLSKSFGEKILFRDFSKTLKKGDRIVLKGPNGCGKTTLVKCILGHIAQDSGTFRMAPAAKIGYLDQEIEGFPDHLTPKQYFSLYFGLCEEELRSEIHKAGLRGLEGLDRTFDTMSDGERKRLKLLSLILEGPNVLFLDEPTNHLDLLTLEALENALLEFEGAILAISHDETFIKKLAPEIWRLE